MTNSDDTGPRAYFNSLERTRVNADNEEPGLGFHRAGRAVIGYVPEVNGIDAEELPVMPTRYELLVLVKHWEEVALDYEFSEAFLLRQGCSSGSRRAAFARARIERMRDVLGDVGTDKAVEEARAAYSEGFSGTAAKAWWAYWHGTEEEIEACRAELDEEIRRWEEEQQRGGAA